MPKTLFQFIWRHSAREQMILLALTVASFPILYLTLELPKTIVNQAIPAELWTGPTGPTTTTLFGFDLGQTAYLTALCFLFLGLVVAGGLLKMYINTRKGVLAERLLRRFRYQLISRILRFPLPYFRRTSQGELISVVTGEAEPLGGIMGDAIAQPVFQGGQMLTILVFLFVQSPWLGLASVALIPLQAWLIPLLQRRLNALNIERVQNVRRLSERIGETVEGVEDLRAHNGVTYALADFSRRLGSLFEIRRKIYQTKFFMKFLANFLNQITPFFFFLFGGMLVISGELTLGALVAALASYKDLISPWKELLAYYNQRTDMSLRYETITERFEPQGMFDEALFEGKPETSPRLDGDVHLTNVTVLDADGAPVLQDLSLTIPAGSHVGIKVRDGAARRALAQTLSRTVRPSSGRITIGEHDLATLHQQTVAQRIGHAGGETHLFNARIGDNVSMALRSAPDAPDLNDPALSPEERRMLQEAILAGNRVESIDADWLDPSIAGARNATELEAWWLKIIRAMGTDGILFNHNLSRRISPERHAALTDKVVALRSEVERRLVAAGAGGAVDGFDRDVFNPSLTVIENLLFAVSRKAAPGAEDFAAIASDPRLRDALRGLGVETMLFRLAEDLLNVLVHTFEGVKGDHPLLMRVAGVDKDDFKRLRKLRDKLARPGLATLDEAESAALLALPFTISPRALGLGFSEDLARRILDARRTHGARLARELSDYFEPLDPNRYNSCLTVFENALFGRVSEGAVGQKELAVGVVSSVLEEAGLRGDIAMLVADTEAGVAGANIPPMARERVAVSRAAIRRPDILVFEKALASQSRDDRQAARERMRKLMPNATIIHLEEEFSRPELFDLVVEVKNGRLVGDEPSQAGALEDRFTAEGADPSAIGDLAAKKRMISRAPLFATLPREQRRLLAYAARWVTAKPGQAIFRAGEAADGAYLFTEGEAELRWPDRPSATDGATDPLDWTNVMAQKPITTVKVGRLIGDLSVISGSPRPFNLLATTDVVALKIGRQELLEVIEGDPTVAASLLRTVGGYLENATWEILALRTGETEAADDAEASRNRTVASSAAGPGPSADASDGQAPSPSPSPAAAPAVSKAPAGS